ncbi:unnamed protein product [Caenorhabditis auriculariae]|uniref:Uncharacterized protein n=1 Tax=Caenorhabditis auriculariae TaxID=2777116 RepID=A0A8S1HPH6_9PELO|nr:unnamed protein product [Caenorhabditis auriculariae]
MSHRSPGRSSYRDRDLSPRRSDRDRERDRERHRDRNSSRNDHESNISRMRAKMRSELDSAKSSISSISRLEPSKVVKEEPLTNEELAERSKAIDDIEKGGFQPASFKSSSGGAGGRVYGHKHQKNEKSNASGSSNEKSHSAAIFGPAWQSAQQKKAVDSKKIKEEVEDITLPLAGAKVATNAPMIPESKGEVLIVEILTMKD